MSDVKDNIKELLDVMDAPSEEDKALITKAYEFAREAHKDHTRMSGEPYFTHLFATAKSLAELGMGPRTISAGFLHDTIEDVDIDPETIEKEFGPEILFLVEGVTKLGALKYRGTHRHVESLRRLFVATSQDIRVLIIKLMDRLHNMKTLSHVPAEKQHRIAMETLEIYAPLADRLGMGRLKRDLEDLAFPFVHAEAYEDMRRIMKEREEIKEDRLEKLLRTLRKALAEHDLRNFRTEYRIKGLYSLYQKLLRKNMEIEKIHDILALRVIVPSVEECYRALGVVHALWRPLPGKIKDYIAFPKPNGYRCIHTTIFTGDGLVIEIQIRTEEMHRRAQFGIASHLSYKEQRSQNKDAKNQGQEKTNRVWIRQLIPSLLNLSWNRAEEAVETDAPETKKRAAPISSRAPDAPRWIKDIASAHSDDARSLEFMEMLKNDFFSHRVFVFTPKGDVIDLPINSSPIDFAYAVHSDIGNHTSGVKVNGKLASLGTSLKNGDIVEVETRPANSPSRKWLEYAKTTMARKHIQTALQKQTSN